METEMTNRKLNAKTKFLLEEFKSVEQKRKEDKKFLLNVLADFLKNDELISIEIQNEYGSIGLWKRDKQSNSHAIGSTNSYD